MLKVSSLIALTFLLTLTPDAFASMGSSGLPTDTGFQMIYNFLTGEYAYLVSIAGVIVGFATLYWGSDMNGFVKTIILMVCLVCIVLGAPSLISALTGKWALIA